MSHGLHHQHRPEDSSRLLPGIWGIGLNTFSLLTEVWLRSNFGGRYLTLLGVVGGILVLLFLPIVVVAVFSYCLSSFFLGSLGGLAAALFTTQMPWANGTIWFHIFTLGFVGRCCFHFMELEYRNRAGLQVLSTYSGMPHYLWRAIPVIGRDESLIKRFGEPALVLILASVVRHIDLLLALYLGVSGIAMFLKAYFEHRLVRNRLTQIIDQRLEAMTLGQQVNGRRQPSDSSGVALPAALEHYPEHQARALTSALQNSVNNPGDYDPGVGANYLGDMFTGLPSEITDLLDCPIPETNLPVTDWFFDDEKEPVVQDWFVNVPREEHSQTTSVATKPKTKRNVGYRCPVCGATYRLRTEHVGKRARCKRCGDLFRVPCLDKFLNSKP